MDKLVIGIGIIIFGLWFMVLGICIYLLLADSSIVKYVEKKANRWSWKGCYLSLASKRDHSALR